MCLSEQNPTLGIEKIMMIEVTDAVSVILTVLRVEAWDYFHSAYLVCETSPCKVNQSYAG